MRDLSALYREVILDHGQRPRNYGRIRGATARAAGDNPLCGDHIEVDVVLAGAALAEVRFEGAGCVIATASASLMTEVVNGKTVEETRVLAAEMHARCSADPAAVPPLGSDEGDPLAAFAGVRRYPLRAKCATLAWRTLCQALDAAPSAVRRQMPAEREDTT